MHTILYRPRKLNTPWKRVCRQHADYTTAAALVIDLEHGGYRQARIVSDGEPMPHDLYNPILNDADLAGALGSDHCAMLAHRAGITQ